MRWGELLDGSFNIYRRHFGLFMRLSLILVWLPTAIYVYMLVRFATSPLELITLVQEHLLEFLGIGLVLVVVWVACSLMLKAGTIRIISDSYLGQEPELGAALRFGASKIIPLLLVALSKGLLFIVLYIVGALVFALMMAMGRIGGVGFAFLMGFVGACGAAWFITWIACAYAVTTPTVILEDLDSSFDAFGRSWELTRGSRLKVFGVGFVAYFIANGLPQALVQGIGQALGTASSGEAPAALVVFAALMGIVLAPIVPCALTLLYYDLRVRREAFDLQILSEQLGMGITEPH